MNETAAFRRTFGEAYQINWVHGDGSIDLAAHISQFTEIGAAMAIELGMEDLGIDEGGFRLFRPLNNDGRDTMLLLERYDDIRVWAAAEFEAQRSPVWMSAVVADADDPRTTLGEGFIMTDDALTPPRRLDADLICIDWLECDPTKKAALVEFPTLVQELTEAVEHAGLDETSVRYFAMTTTAGPLNNLAHIWLEHASPSVMGEVLSWRQSAPELEEWRQRFNALCGSVRSHHLLTQVG